MKDLRSSFDRSYFDLAVGAYIKLCKALDTPLARQGISLATSGRFRELFELSIDPGAYSDVCSFADDYLISKIFSKTLLDVGIDREAASLSDFYEAEAMCASTNEQFLVLMQGGHFDHDIRAVLAYAQADIYRVLGIRPSRERILENCRFGPGATSLVHGHEVRLSKKFSHVLHMTPALYPFWRDVCPKVWASKVTQVDLVPSNEVQFVPKNFKKNRIIAIEPHLNIFVQLGVAREMRRRLKLFGLDIEHQQEENQRLAQLAFSESLSTIDLSMASDTVSIMLCQYLLPPKWFDLLETIRSPYGNTPDGRQIRYEKISSMGNGTTFELETLIFWSLTRATCRFLNEPLVDSRGKPRVATFGDDIVLPRNCYDLLSRVLNFCGFKMNSSKSFREGSFFESCGKDYFNGVNVRPFFFDCDHYDKAEAIFQMANAIRRYAHLRNRSLGCDGRFLPAWLYLYGKAADRDRQCRIPDGYGDGGFVSNWDEVTPRRPRKGWDGWTCRSRIFRPSNVFRNEHGAYLSSLAGFTTGSGLLRGPLFRREALRGPGNFVTRNTVSFGDWTDLGN